jgi:dihydrofolate synthase/folylpolyglutamate synthase
VSASDLSGWLHWLEGVHPREIELGLTRIARVADNLGLRQSGHRLMTVAGTNGKGSTVACLEGIYQAAGCRPGAYTSPHLLAYNERIRVNGEPVSDAMIIEAFRAIDAARGPITLTYFEFATLAATWCFREMAADPWLLEVGLGGRLDATNCFDADLAVVTAIDLDHMEWLGDTREAIAAEKMGIARSGRPVVCADPRPPAMIAQKARQLGAPLWQLGKDYGLTERSGEVQWQWLGPGDRSLILPRPAWMPPAALGNAAGAVMAVSGAAPDLQVDAQAIAPGLRRARLAGRQQRVRRSAAEWLLDVGHNPAAIELLAETLRQHAGRVRMAFALMQRKDLEAVIHPLASVADDWYLLDLDDPQAHPVATTRTVLDGIGAQVVGAGPAASAVNELEQTARRDDLLVGCGSFRVVEALARAGVEACNPGDSSRN